MSLMTNVEQRAVTATVLRGIADELRARKLYDAVRARVSAKVADALEKPGIIMITWHDGSTTDAILEATAALSGRETVRAIGLAMMTGRGIGTLLRPLLDVWIKVSGSGPASLYARLDVAATVLMRGTSFAWIARGDCAGTVRISGDEPAPDANWALWEGVLEYAFVLTHTTGTVAKSRMEEGGRVCHIDISWDPPR
jgi:hypothetical protein